MSYYQVLAHELTVPPAEKPKRKRARHAASTDKAGQFVPDDPATPENEAFEGK